MKTLLVLCAFLCCSGSPGWFSSAASTRSASSGVVFCYYGEWANERPGGGRFGVSDIPADLCTHIVYSFLLLDGPTGNLIYTVETTHEGKSNSVADLIALKQYNADLKILAAIGGWVESSDNFSPVVNNDTLRANFVSNLYNYIDTNGFDGLDLDWEYPAQRGGLESDKEQFVVLVKELKEAFTPKGYLLTSAVAVTQSHIDLSYNVAELNEHLDFINLMTYDYHGTWENETGVNAPLYAQETDDPNLNLNVRSEQNGDYSTDETTLEYMMMYFYSSWLENRAMPKPSQAMNYWEMAQNRDKLQQLMSVAKTRFESDTSVHVWINNGGSPSKLLIGLGAYGKSFTLASLNNTSTGAPMNGAGVPGPYTEEAGIWAYNEICEDQMNNPSAWNITEVAGSYVYANKDLLWIGYDNPSTIYAKAQYAKQMGLGGIMYWAIDLDDFNGVCGEKFPLISQGIAGYASSASTGSVGKLLLLVSLLKTLTLRF